MRDLMPAPSFSKFLEYHPIFLVFTFYFHKNQGLPPLLQPCLSAFYAALTYSKIFILFLKAEQLVSFHAKPWKPPLSYPNQAFVKQKNPLTLLEEESEANLLT